MFKGGWKRLLTRLKKQARREIRTQKLSDHRVVDRALIMVRELGGTRAKFSGVHTTNHEKEKRSVSVEAKIAEANEEFDRAVTEGNRGIYLTRQGKVVNFRRPIVHA